MKTSAFVWLLMIVATSSCSGDRSDATRAGGARASSGTTVQSHLLGTDSAFPGKLPSRAQTLLSADSDRVFIAEMDSAASMIWQVRQGSQWREAWRSSNLYGGIPDVQVGDFDKNGSSDLFWAYEFEEMTGSMVVFRDRGVIREVMPPNDQCNKARLDRRDGRYEVVVQAPGAYSSSDCEDPIPGTCMETLGLGWPEHYAIANQELVKAVETESFYVALAGHYHEASKQLDSLIRNDVPLPNNTFSATYCGREIPARLLVLADSAAVLARSRR